MSDSASFERLMFVATGETVKVFPGNYVYRRVLVPEAPKVMFELEECVDIELSVEKNDRLDSGWVNLVVRLMPNALCQERHPQRINTVEVFERDLNGDFDNPVFYYAMSQTITKCKRIEERKTGQDRIRECCGAVIATGSHHAGCQEADTVVNG